MSAGPGGGSGFQPPEGRLAGKAGPFVGKMNGEAVWKKPRHSLGFLNGAQSICGPQGRRGPRKGAAQRAFAGRRSRGGVSARQSLLNAAMYSNTRQRSS